MTEWLDGDVTSLPFTVLFLCTANRARSPLAEAMLRRHVADGPVEITSRGTEDAGSHPLDDAVVAGDAHGVDIREHRARVLQPGELARTGVAIGFEPFHVSAAVVVGGIESARAFTLPELVELLERLPVPDADGVERAEAFVRAAGHVRQSANARLSAPSLADPAGRSRRHFLGTAQEIDTLTARLATRLFGSSTAVELNRRRR